MYTVITDTAKKSTAQSSNATWPYYNQVCTFVFCQFTNHFSRPFALFLVHFELQLQKEKNRLLNSLVIPYGHTLHVKPRPVSTRLLQFHKRSRTSRRRPVHAILVIFKTDKREVWGRVSLSVKPIWKELSVMQYDINLWVNAPCSKSFQ